jgi:hypothetical protein
MNITHAAAKGIKRTRATARRFIAAFIGVLGIIAAQREEAWANDIAYRETIYNTDFASAGVGGMRNASAAVISLSGVSGTINRAYLYWAGPMNTTNPLAGATLRVNDQPVTGINIGLSDDNCWGYNNSQAYRADVTPLVKAVRNGNYILTDFVHQGTNVNANGASLLVFFNDANTNNNRDVVVFDGNDSNAANPYDALGWNVSLPGVNYLSGQAFFQAHVSDGQVYPDDAVVINGTTVEPAGDVFQGKSVPSENNGPGGFGSLWDIKTWEITQLLSPGTNTIQLTHGYIGHDCVSLIVAAINLPAGAAPPAPPTNHPPVLTGTPVITVNSPDAIPVIAQVTDQDGNALTYRISVDGVEVQTGNVAAGTPTTTGTLSLTNAFTLGQHTVVFTANDGLSTGSFTTTVSVIDNTPPVLHLPPNIVVPADPGKNSAVVTYTVTAEDDFPGVILLSLPASGSAFPIGITTVTATAVDTSGNRSQGTFTITVTDSTPPSVHCPPDIRQYTDPGTNNAIVHYTVPAADNMGVPTLTCTPPSGSVFPIGITTVVCLARDAAGNTATCMFTVTIVDGEAPVITNAANLLLVADLGQCTAVATYNPTVTDNTPGATIVCTPPSGSTFSVGVSPVVCVASDVAGNQATNTFTVTVQDHENPVLSVPGHLTVGTDPGRATAVVNFNVTATDNCSAVNVLCAPPSGSTFPLGTTTVTCTGTDAAGNTASGGFNVTVVDLEPPVVTVPNDIVVPNDPGKYSAVVNFNVGVQDNVPGATVVANPPSGTTFPVGTTLVVVIGTDGAGNHATNSFTVTVVDNELPVLNLPPNITVMVPPGASNAVVEYTVTASDNGPSVTVISTPLSGNSFPIGTNTVNATATDGAGNTATGSFTITVLNQEIPVITGFTNLLLSADLDQCSALVNFVVSLRDVDTNATVICLPPAGSTFPIGVSTVVCIADASGSRSTNSFTVTIEDRERPVLQLPANITVPTAPGLSDAAVTFNVAATDNCSTPIVTATPASGSRFPLGTTTVNVTATDAAGNVTTGTLTVTVRDTEPPVVTVPNNIVVTNDPGNYSAVVTFTVGVQDNVPGATVVANPPSGTTFPVGTTTVIVIGTDTSGNHATNSFTVTVVDSEGPVLNLPPNIIVVAPPGASNAVVEYTVTATDNGPSVTVTTTPPSGTSFPIGTNTVTVTATDGSSNTTTGTFTITVLDEQPPIITGATNLILGADLGQCSALVNYVVSLVDNDPGATMTCTPASGSIFPVGATTVVCTAADPSGNRSTNSFTVTIEDRERPALQLPANISVSTDPGLSDAAVTFNVSATDNCSTPVVMATPASGSRFPLGTTTVNVTATDASGNVTTGTFTVTVRDTEPPVVTVPNDIVVTNDPGKYSAVVTFTVGVQDNVPGATVVADPASGSTFPVGTTTVIVIGTDSSGNHATNSFTVTVVDSEGPVLNLPPNLIVVAPPGASNVVVEYTVTATDNGPSVTVTSTPPSGTSFPIGTNTVTVTATDGSSNTTTGTFTIIVLDQQPPIITGPTNLVLVADLGQCSALVNYTVSLRDIDTNATMTCTPASGSIFPVGVTTVVCTAADTSGNLATNSFTVTIEDHELPALQVPANIAVPTAPGQSDAAVTFNVSATDNCSTPIVTATPASGSSFPLGTTVVNVTATDAAGNVTTAAFTVTVRDTEPPVVIVPNDIVVTNDPGQYSAVVTFTVGVQDNVPGATVIANPPSGTTFPVGTTTVVVIGTDTSGNRATNSFTVTVVDNESPVLNLPPNIIVITQPGASNAVVEYTVTATDNGPSVTVTSAPPSGTSFPLGTNTVTVTATDGSSNTTTGTFTITVLDQQPPIITGATNLILAADLGQCSALVNYVVSLVDADPNATVTCSPASGSIFPVGVTTVVCTAADPSGNRSTNSFIVTIEDREGPALQLPANIVVPASPGLSDALVTFNVSATDNCSTPSVIAAPASGSHFPVGTTTVNVTATDAAGNVSTGSFTVTVAASQLLDTQPPVIQVPTNSVIAADLGQCSAVVTYEVAVTDDRPGATVVCAPPSGSTFPKGVTPVICLAGDAAGNQATNSFTVTVVDLEKPALQLPADLTVTVNHSDDTAVVSFNVTATDNCSVPTVVCLPASGSTFPVGITVVNCTATDADTNSSTGSFLVTVVSRGGGHDLEPPLIQTPTNLIVAADLGQCSAVVDFTVTVTDNVPGATVVCRPPSGSTFPKGVTTVVCDASDVAGNRATNNFTVTVVDRELPALQLPADLAVAVAAGQSGANVNFNVTATDNCSIPLVVCLPASGSFFPIGTTTVNCTATDDDGNATRGSFVVTATPPPDTEPPVITVPTNMIVVTDLGQCSAVVNFTVTVLDNAPGAMVVCAPPSGSTFPKGVTPVVCVAADAALNLATNSFTVTIVDRQPPTLQLPPNLSVTIASNQSNAVVQFNVSATDNCSVPAVACQPASGSSFPVGTTVVTCAAADDDGNTATGTFTVTVRRSPSDDTQPPVIVRIKPSRSVLWPPNHKWAHIQISVKATDDSGRHVTSRIISVSSNEPIDGLGDGDMSPDWLITGRLSLKLRKERSGTGTGRIYTIVVESTDISGNVTISTTTVTVPHDMSQK